MFLLSRTFHSLSLQLKEPLLFQNDSDLFLPSLWGNNPTCLREGFFSNFEQDSQTTVIASGYCEILKSASKTPGLADSCLCEAETEMLECAAQFQGLLTLSTSLSPRVRNPFFFFSLKSFGGNITQDTGSKFLTSDLPTAFFPLCRHARHAVDGSRSGEMFLVSGAPYVGPFTYSGGYGQWAMEKSAGNYDACKGWRSKENDIPRVVKTLEWRWGSPQRNPLSNQEGTVSAGQVSGIHKQPGEKQASGRILKTQGLRGNTGRDRVGTRNRTRTSWATENARQNTGGWMVQGGML